MVNRTRLICCVAAVACILIGESESANILCFFPTPTKSHVLGAQALMKNLASRGHEVTMVSAFPLPKAVKNYHDIYIPIENTFAAMMADFMKGGDRNFISLFRSALQQSLDCTNFTLNSPQFRRLVDEKRHFDVAVVGYSINDYSLGVGPLFNCPMILYFSAGPTRLTNIVGNPNEISSVPHILLGHNNPMTFMNRVKNALIHFFELFGMEYLKHKSETYYNYNFPAEKGFPPYREVRRNVSLVMLNTYFTQTVPRPYLPNMVEVGGLQINTKPEPLPADLQAWLDGAEHGAIFLSFGSNLKSSNLRQDKFDAIIETISKLKQRIIWKWDTDVMPGKPANVFIGKWLPQDAILAHRNLKLFVTHGGRGSITESMYHGVPVVGIPVFGDQEINVAQVVQEGWGVAISFDELTEPLLTGAIQEVLGNSKYAERIEQIATLYKDRPQTAMELATFWVEYVARHKGAPHLHYQGADLNVLQRHLIDVMAFLGVVVYLVFKVVAFLLRRLKRKICGGSGHKVASKQKTS